MMKRIAIIGFGNIAVKHIEVFQALGCDIIASANRSEDKRKAASAYGIPKTYEDYHAMIQREKPNGLIICVSFWNMYEVLKSVIPYRIPILAEKPTGTSFDEHIELADLSKKHETPVMVGLNRRHYSVVRRCIEEIGGKDKITTVLIEWSENPYHLKNNRGLSNDQISKQIFGNTIHGLDLLTSLAGTINDPNIIVKKTPAPFGWLMNLNGISQNEVIYNFNSSWDNPVPWRVVVYATDKRFVFAPLEQCEFTTMNEKIMLPVSEVDQKFKAGFYEQARLFISGINSNNSLETVSNSMNLAQKLLNKCLK